MRTPWETKYTIHDLDSSECVLTWFRETKLKDHEKTVSQEKTRKKKHTFYCSFLQFVTLYRKLSALFCDRRKSKNTIIQM